MGERLPESVLVDLAGEFALQLAEIAHVVCVDMPLANKPELLVKDVCNSRT